MELQWYMQENPERLVAISTLLKRVGTPSLHRRPPLIGFNQEPLTTRWVGGFTILSRWSTVVFNKITVSITSIFFETMLFKKCLKFFGCIIYQIYFKIIYLRLKSKKKFFHLDHCSFQGLNWCCYAILLLLYFISYR